MNPDLIVGGGALVVALGILRSLLLDRSSFIEQKAEIVVLRGDIERLNTKVAHIEGMYDEQRSLKHRAINDLTKAQLVIRIVSDLKVKCNCGALDPLTDVLDSIAESMGGVR